MVTTTERQPPSKSSIIVAAVEGGGTSFVVAVARVSIPCTTSSPTTSEPEILYREEIDSSHDNPSKTLDECVKFFHKYKPNDDGGYDALGIASFGPVGLNKSNINTYGHILSTSPKKSWRNVDIVTPLVTACQEESNSNGSGKTLAVDIETDVNAPALAEYLLIKKNDRTTSSNKDNNNDISSIAYVTVGTGIGVGLVVNGKPVHGRMHPEGGHVHIQQLQNDSFKGYSWGDNCPYHGVGTVEGIASSVALTERLQATEFNNNNQSDIKTTTTSTTKNDESLLSRNSLIELDDDDEIWDHAANAIANLCTTLLLTVSIEKIILGGGIMKRNGLLEKIQHRTIDIINGYIELPSIEDMSSLITTSSYGNNSGLIGSIILAQHAYEKQQQQQKLNRTNSNDDDDDDNKPTKMESTDDGTSPPPFLTGFIHGIVVGAIGVGIGFFMMLRGRQATRK